MIRAGDLSVTQAQHLRRVANPRTQIELARAAVAAVDDDSDLWDEEDEAEDDGAYLSVEDDTIENQPKNKARVFRIRSLDQMVDESDRLSRAYAEGDLAKWVKSDEGAPFKVRLLLKQLDALSR